MAPFQLQAILNVQLGTVEHFCANDIFRWANEPPGMANQILVGACVLEWRTAQSLSFLGASCAAIFEMVAPSPEWPRAFACHRKQFASRGCVVTQYLSRLSGFVPKYFQGF
jgi:hypothetical protein